MYRSVLWLDLAIVFESVFVRVTHFQVRSRPEGALPLGDPNLCPTLSTGLTLLAFVLVPSRSSQGSSERHAPKFGRRNGVPWQGTTHLQLLGRRVRNPFKGLGVEFSLEQGTNYANTERRLFFCFLPKRVRQCPNGVSKPACCSQIAISLQFVALEAVNSRCSFDRRFSKWQMFRGHCSKDLFSAHVQCIVMFR